MWLLQAGKNADAVTSSTPMADLYPKYRNQALQVWPKDPSRHIMTCFWPTSRKIILRYWLLVSQDIKIAKIRYWPYLWPENHRKTRDPTGRLWWLVDASAKLLWWLAQLQTRTSWFMGIWGKQYPLLQSRRQMCTRTCISRMIRLYTQHRVVVGVCGVFVCRFIL